MPKNQRLRFAAGRPDGKWSGEWVFWAHRDSVYIVPLGKRSRGIKISLHDEQGGFRLAYDKSYLLSRPDLSMLPEDRLVQQWPRPASSEQAAHLALRIHLPTRFYSAGEPSDPGCFRFEVVDKSDNVEVLVVYTRAEPSVAYEKLAPNGECLGCFPLPSGEFVWLIVRAFFEERSHPTFEDLWVKQAGQPSVLIEDYLRSGRGLVVFYMWAEHDPLTALDLSGGLPAVG